MPRSSCDICCQPGQLGLTRDSAAVAQLQILCAMLTAIEAGGGGSVTPLTPLAPTFGTADTSSDIIVAANPNRKGLIITNTGDANVSLALGHTALLYQGITLFPGGSWNMGEFDFVVTYVSAIANSDNSNVSIQEFV